MEHGQVGVDVERNSKMELKLPSNSIVALFVVQGLIQVVQCAEAPSIVEHPLDITVERNEPVTLKCKVKGVPKPTIEWFRNGERVVAAPQDPSSHRILLPDGSLFFLRAVQSKKEQDGGVYWCVARNSEGVARSSNATMDIAYLRDDFRVSPSDTDASQGEEVILKCSPPKGNPNPVIRWKKNGEMLDLSSSKRIRIDESGNLIFSPIIKEDRGQYQCSAFNKVSVRETDAIHLKVYEPPTFLTRPQNTDALAGEDVLLTCQAKGDPFPDIQWSREGQDIDINKVKIVHGRGLRIESVHPSDEGTYICEASNAMGKIVTSARLAVREKPVISVKPQAHVVNAEGNEPVTLECLSTGTPKPALFWTLESNVTLKKGRNKPVMIMPGMRINNMYVTSDGSLKIEEPSVADSGHYVCSVVNIVGSFMARAHVVIYDPLDLNGTSSRSHTKDYLAVSEARTDEDQARLALLEQSVRSLEVIALGPTSIKVNWELSPLIPATKLYTEGIRLFYRQRRTDRYEDFEVVRLKTATKDSFAIHSLEEYVEYEVFIQPFYDHVVGLPSHMARVRTHQDVPASPPTLIKAEMVNATAAFLVWGPLANEDHNGPLLGYQIEIRDQSSSKANVTVKSDISEVILLVSGMLPGREYPVRIAAVNTMGAGPFTSAKLRLDPSMVVGHLSSSSSSSNVIGYTWLIVLLGSLAFVLILISGVMLYYHRRATKTHTHPKGGYLAANTADEVSVSHSRMVISSTANSLSKGQQPLWIDRRWPTGTLKDVGSNGSEKKLLATLRNPGSGSGNGSASNSDENEYAYIDRHKLGTFNSGNSSVYEGLVKQQQRLNALNNGMEELEPYASTDILRQQAFNTNVPGNLKSGRYIMPLSVTPMLHSRTSRSDKRHKIYQRNSRDARSCDNIDELDHTQSPYRYSGNNGVQAYAKVSLDKIKTADRFIPNYQGSQIYVPSPQYLFQPKASNTVYSNLTRQVQTGQMSPGKCHRVQPKDYSFTQAFQQQLTHQLPPPLRLTDAYPALPGQAVTAQVHPRKNRNSRSSCSTFSNSESTPFLLNESTNHVSSQPTSIYESVAPSGRNEGVTSFNQSNEYAVDSDPESYLSHSCSDEEESPKSLNQLKPLILPSIRNQGGDDNPSLSER